MTIKPVIAETAIPAINISTLKSPELIIFFASRRVAPPTIGVPRRKENLAACFGFERSRNGLCDR